MTTETETPRAALPAVGAHPALCMAFLCGRPLTQAQAEALYSYVTGQRVVDWREKALRYPDESAAHLRAAEEQDERVAACATVFLAAIARMIDAPEELLRFEANGVPAPVTRMNFGAASQCLKSAAGTVSLDGMPPRLVVIA